MSVRIKSKKGSMTVEALFAMVIYSLIGVGIATVATLAFKQTKSTAMVGDYADMINMLKSVSSDALYCTNIFKNTPFVSGSSLNVTLPSGIIIKDPGTAASQTYDPLHHRVFTIDALQFAGVTPLCSPPSNCNNAYGGFIYVQSQFGNRAFSGTIGNTNTTGILYKEDYIPIYVHTDGAGKIVDCLGAKGDGPIEVCTNLGGIYDFTTKTCHTPAITAASSDITASASAGCPYNGASCPDFVRDTFSVFPNSKFSFCALTSRVNGGNSSQEGCGIQNLGGGVWSIRAWNFNSPGVWCSMRCLCQDPSNPATCPPAGPPNPLPTPFPPVGTPKGGPTPTPTPTATATPTPTPTPTATFSPTPTPASCGAWCSTGGHCGGSCVFNGAICGGFSQSSSPLCPSNEECCCACP